MAFFFEVWQKGTKKATAGARRIRAIELSNWEKKMFPNGTERTGLSLIA